MGAKYTQLIRLIRETKPPMFFIGLAMFLAIVGTGAALWVPLLTRDFIDGMDPADFSMGGMVLLGFALVLQAVAGGVAMYFLGIAGHAVVATLRKRLFAKLIHLPVPFYDDQESGELTSRIISDTLVLKELITTQLVSFVSGFVRILGSIVILFMLDWKMALVLFVSVIAALSIIKPVSQRMGGIARDVQKETADFTSQLSRLLSEIRLVKAYVAEGFELNKGNGSIDALFELGKRESLIKAIMGPIITLALMASLVVILGYGGARVATGELQIGELIAFILYIFNIVLPLVTFGNFFAELARALGATERLVDLLGLEGESNGQTKALPQGEQVLTFQNVGFHYNTESGPILHGVDIRFEPGKVTALVGPSGSGKSTIFALIERFYSPESGALTYGDIPIGDLALPDWRGRLGYVAQDSPVMSGTIRDNICYGLEREVDESTLREAAAKAYAAEFIEKLPEGYNTEVGERGVKLSGGQRQRIAIARALLKDPQILMLDEATSSLDSQAEQMVQKALGNLMEGRTTLVIAHRLSTVVNADRIVVLEQGKITGSGTHPQLLESNALYRELVEQQFNAANEVV